MAMAAIQKCGFQLVEDPPYFPENEKGAQWSSFCHDVMNDVDHFLRDQNGAFYTEGIRLLHDCWTKCVNVGGDYVEK